MCNANKMIRSEQAQLAQCRLMCLLRLSLRFLSEGVQSGSLLGLLGGLLTRSLYVGLG